MLEGILYYLLAGYFITVLLAVRRGPTNTEIETLFVGVAIWPFVLLYGVYLLLVSLVRWGLE